MTRVRTTHEIGGERLVHSTLVIFILLGVHQYTVNHCRETCTFETYSDRKPGVHALSRPVSVPDPTLADVIIRTAGLGGKGFEQLIVVFESGGDP